MESAPIGEACRLIRSVISDPAARLSVAIETGPDEAFLIGTADAYLRLALAALEFVADAQAGRAQRRTVGGLTIADSAAFGDAIKPGEVWLSGGWLTASAEEAQALSEYILWLSPPADQNP